ncbi:PREDICTED: uncharacterized protein LOC104825113 isoform X2 [Tarenaya hassleriana]|uniref:uncharacterized protein LOC104825113 isoform X2 n=1 Tax=Tarenaya hassleriana TaxID=28532 RepID=UPI0008FD7442|nr:PREDICTED: uncharacterized protein LOC104825113 isoform X2 [Tarenaya hassleriana]XP_019058536.1 PREDICTED: uncharacterized protein LOC104825113 isoform X2 [Tarenaya hassleriana]
MLFAADGGGFFSSSASGYSKGLALLLLGHKNEGKPVRVTLWNRYHLVDQEPYTSLHLASFRNRLSRACTSFICFGRTSAGPESPSPLKVGPPQPQAVPSGSPIHHQGRRDHAPCIDGKIEETKRIALKSSLKKRSFSGAVPADGANRQDPLGHIERRKVQWPDTCGIDLAEVREFEPSEMGGSEDGFQHGTEKSCTCTIM